MWQRAALEEEEGGEGSCCALQLGAGAALLALLALLVLATLMASSHTVLDGSWKGLSARAVTSALSLKESGIGGTSWPAGAAGPAPESSSSEAEEAAAAVASFLAPAPDLPPLACFLRGGNGGAVQGSSSSSETLTCSTSSSSS